MWTYPTLKQITCDVPSEFEQAVADSYPAAPQKHSDEIVDIFFYDRMPGHFPDLSDATNWFNEVHGDDALKQIKLHPKVGGVEIHVRTDVKNAHYLINNILGLGSSIGKKLGCSLRSINGLL